MCSGEGCEARQRASVARAPLTPAPAAAPAESARSRSSARTGACRCRTTARRRRPWRGRATRRRRRRALPRASASTASATTTTSAAVRRRPRPPPPRTHTPRPCVSHAKPPRRLPRRPHLLVDPRVTTALASRIDTRIPVPRRAAPARERATACKRHTGITRYIGFNHPHSPRLPSPARHGGAEHLRKKVHMRKKVAGAQPASHHNRRTDPRARTPACRNAYGGVSPHLELPQRPPRRAMARVGAGVAARRPPQQSAAADRPRTNAARSGPRARRPTPVLP